MADRQKIRFNKTKVEVCMLYICGMYIVCFILTALSPRLKAQKKHRNILWGLFVLALAYVAFCMNPITTWDLSRHYIYMDMIRDHNISLTALMFESIPGMGEMQYQNLYLFNVIRYLACNLTADNRFLPFVMILIDYTIVAYIMVDWSKENGKYGFVTFLCSFAFLPYLHAVSGMRNATAACLAALGIYLYLYKKHSAFTFAVLVLLGIMIHPSVAIVIPFVFLARINLKTVGLLLVVFCSALTQWAAELMAKSHIPYLQLIGEKYYRYVSEEQYRSSRFALYGVILLIILFLLTYFIRSNIKRSQLTDSADKRKLYNFIIYYMLYILGNIGNYDMVLRPAYVIGALSPVFLSVFMDKKLCINRDYKFLYYWLNAACIGLCFYINYKFLLLFIKGYTAYF